VTIKKVTAGPFAGCCYSVFKDHPHRKNSAAARRRRSSLRSAEQHNLQNATQLVNTFFTPETAFPSPQNSSPDTAKPMSWLRKRQLLQITSHPSHQDRGKLLDPQQTVKGKITAGVKYISLTVLLFAKERFFYMGGHFCRNFRSDHGDGGEKHRDQYGNTEGQGDGHADEKEDQIADRSKETRATTGIPGGGDKSKDDNNCPEDGGGLHEGHFEHTVLHGFLLIVESVNGTRYSR
jgi:hypothetical protein